LAAESQTRPKQHPPLQLSPYEAQAFAAHAAVLWSHVYGLAHASPLHAVPSVGRHWPTSASHARPPQQPPPEQVPPIGEHASLHRSFEASHVNGAAQLLPSQPTP
jgi:hypothetical protein